MHEPSFLILFALGLLLTGCLSGFLAGLPGVGGGIVVVPAGFILIAASSILFAPLGARTAHALEFVRDKWEPVIPKRQTKSKSSRGWLVQNEPDGL